MIACVISRDVKLAFFADEANQFRLLHRATKRNPYSRALVVLGLGQLKTGGFTC